MVALYIDVSRVPKTRFRQSLLPGSFDREIFTLTEVKLCSTWVSFLQVTQAKRLICLI
jgi:hypothetical protein